MNKHNYLYKDLYLWIEGKYGPGVARDIFKKLEEMDGEQPPECLALKMMGDLLSAWRKDLLRQIREYKAERRNESNRELLHIHSRRRLHDRQQTIKNGIESWRKLRTDLFMQRECFARIHDNENNDTRRKSA